MQPAIDYIVNTTFSRPVNVRNARRYSVSTVMCLFMRHYTPALDVPARGALNM